MAEDDIYENKAKYEAFYQDLTRLLKKPEKRRKGLRGHVKYRCQNPANLRYFEKLKTYFELRDLSFIRRLRILQNLLIVTNYTAKDLAELQQQEELSGIVANAQKALKSPESKQDFIKHVKLLWKQLFPEKDEHGRPDSSIVPYPVRHLKAAVDPSKQKGRNDKLTWEEYEKLLGFFGTDPRMKAYIAFATESLGRPQEILYLRLKDLEIHDNYIVANISEHSKTGLGMLQCIDSYPYMSEWLGKHPQKGNPEAFVFINIGHKALGKQMMPFSINKRLRLACKSLGISKRVTCYSFKRNGVTFRRLRGDTDVEIQHTARWKSTKQLRVYDQSDGKDALRIALAKRGLIKDDIIKPMSKSCVFCQAIIGLDQETCPNCRRLTDRQKAAKQEYEREVTLLQRVFESAEGRAIFERVFKKMLAEKKNF
ncbi:site-specific integrase [Candidatus Woesearchaeota archaeon]|nr:site-specific integrase [Candidatus Woesearchaeota archaeon]